MRLLGRPELRARSERLLDRRDRFRLAPELAQREASVELRGGPDRALRLGELDGGVELHQRGLAELATQPSVSAISDESGRLARASCASSVASGSDSPRRASR
jgi:hypothetical protein